MSAVSIVCSKRYVFLSFKFERMKGHHEKKLRVAVNENLIQENFPIENLHTLFARMCQKALSGLEELTANHLVGEI